MTHRDELMQLARNLPEEQVGAALTLLRQLTPAEAVDNRASRRLPAFVGMGHSGRSDISERMDEVLEEERFGR